MRVPLFRDIEPRKAYWWLKVSDLPCGHLDPFIFVRWPAGHHASGSLRIATKPRTDLAVTEPDVEGYSSLGAIVVRGRYS